MGRTLKDSFNGRNDFSLLPFSYKVLGCLKELENVIYIFPACYSVRQFLNNNLIYDIILVS